MPQRPAQHQPAGTQGRKAYDLERGTANERGYTYRWQQYTKRYLNWNPLCRMCEQVNRITIAELVDHIIPVKGADDPRFFEESNHQGLCRPCHALKTAEDVKKGLTR
jgi:5-methylcytosine-specific restriction protein A